MSPKSTTTQTHTHKHTNARVLLSPIDSESSNDDDGVAGERGRRKLENEEVLCKGVSD